MLIRLSLFPGEWCVLAWTSKYIRILYRKKENPKFNQWHQRALEVWRQENLSQTLVARFSSDSHRIKAKDAVTVLVHKLQGYGSTNESGKGNISGSSLGSCSKKKSCAQTRQNIRNQTFSSATGRHHSPSTRIKWQRLGVSLRKTLAQATSNGSYFKGRTSSFDTLKGHKVFFVCLPIVSL